MCPILEAAAELGELHAARFTEPGNCNSTVVRLRLARHIDMLVMIAAPIPRSDALLHAESVGAVIDQIAAQAAIAYQVPSARVSSSEIDDAHAHLLSLSTDYVELIDKLATGSCCLPPTHLQEDVVSGIHVLEQRRP